ncbi:hypothetical protein GCM10020221_18560 [Streptomyces thioluteus]|uniref:Uncharacterized protein n=1 Tax=Streptomyces thioluteus TaxID=66431 RepID=A0ABN3WNE2_STRTU
MRVAARADAGGNNSRWGSKEGRRSRTGAAPPPCGGPDRVSPGCPEGYAQVTHVTLHGRAFRRRAFRRPRAPRAPRRARPWEGRHGAATRTRTTAAPRAGNPGGVGAAVGREPVRGQRVSLLPLPSAAARPASSRATGMRNGEQET